VLPEHTCIRLKQKDSGFTGTRLQRSWVGRSTGLVLCVMQSKKLDAMLDTIDTRTTVSTVASIELPAEECQMSLFVMVSVALVRCKLSDSSLVRLLFISYKPT
jgi:hypothetical protein